MNSTTNNIFKSIYLSAFLGFTILIMFLSCSGCNNEKVQKDKAPNNIVSNAEKYIMDKYNIRAEVIDSQADYEWEGFDFIIPHKKYTGTYSLDMNADCTDFNVFVDSDGSIADDYQFPEINKSLQEFFSEMLPSPDIRVQFTGNMLSDFIDCSDMEIFLDEYYSDVIIYLVDSDINSESFNEIKNFARNCGSSIWLMSCRSAGDRNSLIDGRRTRSRGDAASTQTSLGSDYAMYVKEIWKCMYHSKDSTHTEEYNELKIENYGDLYYTIPENSDVTVTESNKNYYSDKSSDEKYKLITPAYDLKCSENITVFYPVALAEDVELEYYQTYKCGRNQVDIIGDYFVYRIHTKKWYADNHYYGEGDEKFFGVYVDNYY